VTFALYATIWCAIALFVAGEWGKRSGTPPAPLWWRLWAAGAFLSVIHIPIALVLAYGGSHELAVEETARRTAAVYGLDWGGGVYINYVFVGAWVGEAAWWRVSPASYFARARVLTWALRAFYFVMIVNAAVVFASPAGRVAGIVAAGVLVWTWRK